MFPETPIDNLYDDQGVALMPLATYLRDSTGSGAVTRYSDARRIRRDAAAVILGLEVGAYTGTEYDFWCDVYVQTRIGNVWYDVKRFTRINYTRINFNYADKIAAGVDISEYKAETSDLQGGDKFRLIGDEWRVKWVISDSEPGASLEFAVTIIPVG
jgi:hypothetical protein